MNIKRAFTIALLVAAVCVGTARAQSLTTVRIGLTGSDDMVSVLYAQKTGMFQRAGLDVILDRSSANGSAIAAAVLSGTYDLGKTSVTAIIDAHLREVPFTVVAAAGVYESSRPFGAMIVAKGSPIQAARDLKEGVVGLSFLRDLGQLALTKILDEAGIGVKGLQFTEVPMSAAGPAVEQGRVIAAEMSNPALQAALDTGKFRSIPVYNAFGNSYVLSAWFTTKDYVAKHPDVVRNFTRVQIEAARYTNAHHDETAPMLAEFTGVPLDAVKRTPRVTNGTGITPTGIQSVIDIEAKYGWISRSFPAREIIEGG